MTMTRRNGKIYIYNKGRRMIQVILMGPRGSVVDPVWCNNHRGELPIWDNLKLIITKACASGLVAGGADDWYD
jgi:hypothetical protein